MQAKRSLLNYIGIAILVLGMATGEFIYWRSLHSGYVSEMDDPDSPYNSKVYERTLQTNVGTLGLILDQITRSLGEPKSQAIIIVVVSLAGAVTCFVLAARMPGDS